MVLTFHLVFAQPLDILLFRTVVHRWGIQVKQIRYLPTRVLSLSFLNAIFLTHSVLKLVLHRGMNKHNCECSIVSSTLTVTGKQKLNYLTASIFQQLKSPDMQNSCLSIDCDWFHGKWSTMWLDISDYPWRQLLLKMNVHATSSVWQCKSFKGKMILWLFTRPTSYSSSQISEKHLLNDPSCPIPGE